MAKKYRSLLSIQRYEDESTVIFMLDDQRNPILDEDKIMVIKYKHLRGLSRNHQIALHFDSQNRYQILRYEVLERYPTLEKLKGIVDKKIKNMSHLEECVNEI